ncbi:hypothetical protein Tco_0689352 [Tanacetum coccineum]
MLSKQNVLAEKLLEFLECSAMGTVFVVTQLLLDTGQFLDFWLLILGFGLLPFAVLCDLAEGHPHLGAIMCEVLQQRFSFLRQIMCMTGFDNVIGHQLGRKPLL